LLLFVGKLLLFAVLFILFKAPSKHLRLLALGFFFSTLPSGFLFVTAFDPVKDYSGYFFFDDSEWDFYGNWDNLTNGALFLRG